MNQQTIICSNCKTPNPAQNLYCQSCGRPLIPVSPLPPAPAPADLTVPVPAAAPVQPPQAPTGAPETPPAAGPYYPPPQTPPQGYGAPQGYPPAGQQPGYPSPQSPYPQQGYTPQQQAPYPPAAAPQGGYYQPPRPQVAAGPKLEQLGARVDGWADVIAGAAEKADDVEKSFVELLTERKPDGARLAQVEYTSGPAKRAYQVYSTAAGAVAVYIGALGKDLLVSWDLYVMQKPRWLMIGILGAVTFVISFLHAITMAYSFGAFFINWIFDVFSWVLLVIVGALIVGKIFYGSIWTLFIEKADEFAIQDLGGMALEVDQALRKSLAEAGVDVSSLRSKHSFRAGDADRKV